MSGLASAEKHDVFVGNVTANTTEEQLREIFQFVGPVKNIRILIDKDTGRPKGFAFIEYADANSALAAIRHLDGHELNQRQLKVSYSNNR
jgi:cleavage stimulation factor subunit 2